MHHEPVRHRGTLHRALVAACASLVAVVLLVAPSSSAPDDTADVPDGFPTEPPGLVPYVTSMTQNVAARRAKMFIKVDADAPMLSALYVSLWNTPVDDPTTYKAVQVAHAFAQPPCATADPETQAKGTFFRSAVYPFALTPGGSIEPGVVARVPVRMVSFGAIPATATLTLRIPRVDGKFRPLLALVWSGAGGRGRTTGCDPDFESDATTVIKGSVQLSVSDLEVDGVPVDLGASCRTSRPVQLQLRNEGQYAPGSGGNLAAYDGLGPASFGPLNSPYYYEDNGKTIPATTGITIPPFTGCGTAGDDLSPLVTALASGPNNPIRVSQARPAPHLDGVMPWGDILACTVVCPLPAPPAPSDPPLPEADQ